MADDMISKNVFMSVGVAIFLWTQFFVPTQCQAVPSFARQTGMPCTACHTSFPQLTPYGRFFKLNGYVMSNDQGKLPPIAMMVMPSFTHTQKSQAEDPADGFDKNNDLAITQASVFYAGRLFGPYAKDIFDTDTADMANKIGVFLQGTFDGVAEKSTWDNAEIRYANTAELFGGSAVYGLYANNNPSMQDLWNTTPVWGYPFSGSGLAPTPGAGTLLGGGVSQQVGGMGTYLRLENGLYLDVGAYRTLRSCTLLANRRGKNLGTSYVRGWNIWNVCKYLSGPR